MKKFDEDLTMFVRVDKEDEPLVGLSAHAIGSIVHDCREPQSNQIQLGIY
jgi:hypothetical protein